MNWRQLIGTGHDLRNGFWRLSPMAERACVAWFKATALMVLVFATCWNVAWHKAAQTHGFRWGMASTMY